MENITVKQFLMFTNMYVPLYIEDEFKHFEPFSGTPKELLEFIKRYEHKHMDDCPIDYIRNVDGGHFGDDEKDPHGIVIGIGIENFEKYFKD